MKTQRQRKAGLLRQRAKYKKAKMKNALRGEEE